MCKTEIHVEIEQEGRNVYGEPLEPVIWDGLCNYQDSGRQVQRYIRLTKLISQLLKLVDDERIAFSVGVELSYLTKYEQEDLFEAIELEDKTPSLSQAIQM